MLEWQAAGRFAVKSVQWTDFVFGSHEACDQAIPSPTANKNAPYRAVSTIRGRSCRGGGTPAEPERLS